MRPSGGDAIVPHPTRGSRVSTTEQLEAGEDFEDEPEADAEVTPLDAAADADAGHLGQNRQRLLNQKKWTANIDREQFVEIL